MKGFSGPLKKIARIVDLLRRIWGLKIPAFLNSLFEKNQMFGLLHTLNSCTANKENIGILDGSTLENCFPFK